MSKHVTVAIKIMFIIYVLTTWTSRRKIRFETYINGVQTCAFNGFQVLLINRSFKQSLEQAGPRTIQANFSWKLYSGVSNRWTNCVIIALKTFLIDSNRYQLMPIDRSSVEQYQSM